MKSIREVIALFLAAGSLIAVPVGVVALVAGIYGGLADTDWAHNVRIGFAEFSLSLALPVGFVVWIRLWRNK